MSDIQAISEDEPDTQAMECDEELRGIKAINPNVRSRKLEVNEVAKAKQEEAKANGVAPPIKKRLSTKQPVKKGTLKAKKINEWYAGDPHAAEASKGKPTRGKAQPKAKSKEPKAKEDDPKAKEDDPNAKSDAQALQVGTACRKGIKNADALILSAHGSKNADTGRFDDQGKCTLPDGSCKTMGIIGFYGKESFGVQVWDTLMTKINGAKGQLSKGDIVMLRDKLIARCRAGHPCIDLDAA